MFLIGITVAVSSHLCLPVANAFMAVLMSVMLFVYLFSIAGFMQVGYVVVAIISIAAIVFCIAKYNKTKQLLFSAPIVTLVALVVFSVFINNAIFTTESEVIDYWLPGLEYILDTGRLPYSEAGLLPSDILHPPLLWILQYFMLFGNDGEVIVYINSANNLLSFACVLPFFGDEKPNDRYDVILLTIKFILIFGLLGTESGFTDLSVGRQFALLFGYGIYLAMTKPCNKKFETIELSLILSGVMLLNSTGFAFAFLILLIARVMAFLSSPEKNIIRKTYRASKEHFAATVALTATSLSFVLLLFISGNTDPTAAITSVFVALEDFIHWAPYTLTVLAILLLPALSYDENGEKRLKI